MSIRQDVHTRLKLAEGIHAVQMAKEWASEDYFDIMCAEQDAEMEAFYLNEWEDSRDDYLDDRYFDEPWIETEDDYRYMDDGFDGRRYEDQCQCSQCTGEKRTLIDIEL